MNPTANPTMEIWFLIILSLCSAFLLKAIVDLLHSSGKPKSKPLPPSPAAIPIISAIRWHCRPVTKTEPILRSLRSKLGPIFSLRYTAKPVIFIFDAAIIHKAFIQNGAVFADRPIPPQTSDILTVNQCSVSSARYGEKWRILRRNLTSQILHPSRIKAFSPARSRVLQILLESLRSESNSVKAIDHFRHAAFCLLVFMCFGDVGVDDEQIGRIADVHHRLHVALVRYEILNVFPRITKFLLRRKWRELYDLKKDLEDIVIPLKRAREQISHQDDVVPCYLDSLMDLELPSEDGEKRKMSEEQMVPACSEFLNAGTDSTSTALEWIMASLVKNQTIQSKLFEEISRVIGQDTSNRQEIKEEELEKMEYLKAVVLEGLRRHPPAHFVLPHTVTQTIELEGYTVPKYSIINILISEMGLDPKVWEDPMEFKPERFLGAECDLTCSKEIKMMPFGAGRRICPGMGLALLHLEYLIANLVWHFEWKEADGYSVDFSEKPEFTISMKNSLRARITPRSRG